MLVAATIATLVVRDNNDGDRVGDLGDLTPAEIVRRSGEAMAAIPLLRVESAEWPFNPRPDDVQGISVTEYTRDTIRSIRVPAFDLRTCPAQDSKLQVFTDRHLGGLRFGGGAGATGPSDFALLREETMNGADAWVVRYTYERRGIEGPIRTEDTEWIAKSDYRLLRQEKVYLDMGGTQVVSIPIPITARATDCPSKPTHSLADLAPRTKPGIGYD